MTFSLSNMMFIDIFTSFALKIGLKKEQDSFVSVTYICRRVWLSKMGLRCPENGKMTQFLNASWFKTQFLGFNQKKIAFDKSILDFGILWNIELTML